MLSGTRDRSTNLLAYACSNMPPVRAMIDIPCMFDSWVPFFVAVYAFMVFGSLAEAITGFFFAIVSSLQIPAISVDRYRQLVALSIPVQSQLP